MIKRIFAPAVAALLAALIVYGFVPPPRKAAAQFSEQSTWVGTAGGTANAIILNVANVNTSPGAGVPALRDIFGVPIRFIPSANNTQPVTIVIQNAIGTSSAIPLLRPSSIGLVALSLNELWAGEMTSVTYDGTEFVLSSNVDTTPIGHVVEMRGSSAPRGALIEDGSCYSQTQFAALFSVIGTTYNAGAPSACSGSQFAVPDSRGSLFAALDNQGANGAAGRLNSASSGCGATSVAFRCGSQNTTLARSDLPNTTITANSTVSDVVQAATFFGGVPGSGGPGEALGSPTTGVLSSTFALNGGVMQTTPTNVPPVLGGITAIKY